MLKLLKNTHSYLILLFLFINTSFFLIDFVLERSEFPLYDFHISNVFWVAICMLLLSFHCIGLNNIVHEKDVIKKPNFVTAFVFLMLCTPFNLNPINNLVSLILLFFLSFILTLHKKKSPFKTIYNASIILSICSLIIPEVLFLSLLIIISSMIFRNISLRVFLIIILGVSTPYIFIYTYKYLFDLNFKILQFKLNSISYINISDYYISIINNDYKSSWYICLFIIILFSAIDIFNWMYKKSSKSRESFIIIICYLIILCLVAVFFYSSSALYLCLTPLSIIISNFFVYHRRSYLSEIIFILFVFISIFYRVSMINL